ncbi:flagellar export chaperone FliS [Bdellovibrio sp. 22V]|uniref:flagellar export chaperone FliS n=1 Tax=Bdellovibrio TaxID=958 RepID=UPI002542EF4D|nr:flagellar export chaperone FliS [Bdellovibrio sp. 22V]WII70741.1 flagellar export chaperone FliS [Bdellovibrio sp. 22V]
MNKNAYQKYKTTSVQSASREKILLMLYEGAIKFTKLAIKAAEEKKIADRGMNIGRAFDIIMELNNTLDHKVGGDVALQLEQLYMFMMEQYTKANISGDPEPLRANLKLLQTLYDGWVQAVEKLKKETDNSDKKAG